MLARSITALGLLVAALTVATAFSAILSVGDVPVAGTKIGLSDNSGPGGRRTSIVLSAGDPSGVFPDPRATGATAYIGRVGVGEVTTILLPAAGWSGGTGPKQDYKFKSRTGTAISARLRAGGSLRFSARGNGAYPLGGVLQNEVGIILDVAGVRFCSLFGGRKLRDDGTRFRAIFAPAPASCPQLGAPGTTTSSSTSTSTTTLLIICSPTTTSTTIPCNVGQCDGVCQLQCGTDDNCRLACAASLNCDDVIGRNQCSCPAGLTTCDQSGTGECFDLSTSSAHCGQCNTSCGGGVCTNGSCECAPDCVGRECGPDGCGGSCSACSSSVCDGADGTCHACLADGHAPCTDSAECCSGNCDCLTGTCEPAPGCAPTVTCATEGFDCGTFTNDCGQLVTCGSCPAPGVCGASEPNLCGIITTTTTTTTTSSTTTTQGLVALISNPEAFDYTEGAAMASPVDLGNVLANDIDPNAGGVIGFSSIGGVSFEAAGSPALQQLVDQLVAVVVGTNMVSITDQSTAHVATITISPNGTETISDPNDIFSPLNAGDSIVLDVHCTIGDTFGLTAPDSQTVTIHGAGGT